MIPWTMLFLVSIVSAFVSFTITETHLFASIRKRADKIAYTLGTLFSCGFCFGTWTSAGLVALTHVRAFPGTHPAIDFVLTSFLVAWISGLHWIIACLLWKAAGK